MQVKIIEKKEQPILSRTAVKSHIIFDKSTPSSGEVKKSLASELKADENLVVVKEIYTEFGKPEADVNAYVYASKETMKKTEKKPRKQKRLETEEAKKAAEAKKEEMSETKVSEHAQKAKLSDKSAEKKPEKN